ncbi:glucan biosynthesis protein D [Rhodospirillum rubrum]|uniref:glucan biosynthesis protein n=1 Tax=Rhodospirillum rubrum TaxID=1085 RepID=UPI0019080315|nr:glucan biosynthesis protein G [Rhodospirillum rubrum]MBK1665934.1 glucan biosynthesis protein D [Rhodospirillum rubrum]MBK1678064.1 glucan biosynthesis protein D [Rhodospirillum rubrum]
MGGGFVGAGLLNRRGFLGMSSAVALAAAVPGLARAQQAADEGEGTFARLVERAREMAGQAYVSPDFDLPASLASLDYDTYRSIRFRKDRALWAGERPFHVELFHLGGYFRQPVRVLEVRQGRFAPIPYDQSMFDFGEVKIPEGVLAQMPGFSGLRIHAGINDPNVMDDVAVFQGASYFRVLGAGSNYGASARGVAIDTALASGEEFPAFAAFYLVPPSPGADRMDLMALLDGPSITGAYAFSIIPGNPTRVAVECRLFARRDIKQLGIAPLTSMFDFSPVDRLGVDDFRPRVHDSEGLAMHTGRDEWLWRPLTNPDRLETNIYMDATPKGFGLLQRTRGLSAYQDLEARYDLRPSVWVVPRGDWGPGSVRLVEIPTPNETNDNIVAFWTPEKQLKAGGELTFSYDLLWGMEVPASPLARVVATSAGHYGIPSVERPKGERSRKFVVEFAGGPLAGVDDLSRVAVEASADNGRLSPAVMVRNPTTGGVRIYLDVLAENNTPVNLRVCLRVNGAAISETWTMQWRPTTGE